jgi:hypothetical protein
LHTKRLKKGMEPLGSTALVNQTDGLEREGAGGMGIDAVANRRDPLVFLFFKDFQTVSAPDFKIENIAHPSLQNSCKSLR